MLAPRILVRFKCAPNERHRFTSDLVFIHEIAPLSSFVRFPCLRYRLFLLFGWIRESVRRQLPWLLRNEFENCSGSGVGRVCSSSFDRDHNLEASGKGGRRRRKGTAWHTGRIPPAENHLFPSIYVECAPADGHQDHRGCVASRFSGMKICLLLEDVSVINLSLLVFVLHITI